MSEWWDKMESRASGNLPIWERCPPADTALLQQLVERWGAKLPKQYLQFLSESNGAALSFVEIWSAEVVLSDPYFVKDFGPHLVFFGTDHCGELFAFDEREDCEAISMVAVISNWKTDTKVIAKDFAQFLQRLEKLVNDEGSTLLDDNV